MKAIGIDIGTTSVCGVVIDVEKGCVVKSKTENSDAFLKGCAENTVGRKDYVCCHGYS